MQKLAPEEWKQVFELLDTALEVPAPERNAWLATLDASRAALKPALVELLARHAHRETDDFLRALPQFTVIDRDEDPPSNELKAGARIGPYRLSLELGRGGMASVWLAERADGLLQRPVALKLPHNIAYSRGLAERMARERTILAALTHPNIARLYDAGVTDEGIPWLAIEYIEGRPLDEYCRGTDDKALPLRQRLELFLQVGEAVAYAHGKLVVHRDLKPGNILVTSDGQVRLLDFGIATLIEGNAAPQTPLTEIGGRALTLDYAAPEYIARGEYTTSADVYSLGVILYELLTGRRPHVRDKQARAMFESSVLSADVPRASDVAPPAARRALRGDLDVILDKALKKDPAERYRTVSALVDDVTRHLEARPVLAQPERAAYRAWKFVKRHKLGVASAAAVVVAVLAGSLVTFWQSRVALAERDRAEEVKSFITSIFQGANPYASSGGDLSAAEMLRRARTQIDREFATRPDLRIELLGIVGSSLNGLGSHADAEATLRDAVDLATRTRGPHSLETVRARIQLADVYNRQSDTDRLGPELRELLPLAQAVSTQDQEPLIRVWMYSADYGIEAHELLEARANAKQAFELAHRVYGDQHRLTVQASNLLAESYTFAPYDFPTINAQAIRALALAQAAFPPPSRDPLLLYAEMLRARAHTINGEYRLANVLKVANVKELRAQFGDNNRDVANALTELAGNERIIGELTSAIRHEREALAIFEKLGDTQSADYVNALIDVGRTKNVALRPREALDYFSRAYALNVAQSGAADWNSVYINVNVALALAGVGRQIEAQKIFADIDASGATIELPQFYSRRRASTLRLCGQHERAVEEFQRALKLTEDTPHDDWVRMEILGEMGLSEFALGHHDTAMKLLEQSRSLSERYQAGMTPLFSDELVAIGRIELDRGHADNAQPLFARVDAYWQSFDPAHPRAREAREWVDRAKAGMTAANR